MKLGAVLPTSEIKADPAAIRDYAQAADSLGYDHLVLFDHVLGEDPSNRAGGRGGIDYTDKFHEPFVMFGFLAAVTERIKLSTGILILPQRQTVLVAKQAAEADVLSGGRLRLGVGVGWNRVEFDGLGAEFGKRGRRMEEQVAVLRALWTEEIVAFDGEWHTIQNAGLNPMPAQRPIPLWFGGHADVVLDRIGRLGDGWIISSSSRGHGDVPPMIERIHMAAKSAGRDPEAIGIETWVRLENRPTDSWLEEVEEWRSAGVHEIALNTQKSGCLTVTDHIAALERCKGAFDAM